MTQDLNCREPEDPTHDSAVCWSAWNLLDGNIARITSVRFEVELSLTFRCRFGCLHVGFTGSGGSHIFVTSFKMAIMEQPGP